ncbi:MAG: hypothetical protein RDU24_14035 [Humidesulfovibrio sp.]|uniref:hypothetical protein n=1 Tax=Humidesulfovibrio sp. TaxID=2910988 RepID=UPI0027EEFA28|nr:hypothetical protein [Humidesulfovibrio sp.]MDQ7836497.1 hypothetical protein [Humidesulfovibrio sp.]
MHSSILKSLLCLFLVLTLSACSGMATRSSADSVPTAGGSQAETYDNPNYYYLFDDILIPNGMEHSGDEDFSFDTQQFKAGIQIFQGRVIYDDLINFFLNNMVKDGWKKVSAVRSKKSILIFEKANKAAIIELNDGYKAKATVFAFEYKGGTYSNSNRTSSPRPGTAKAPAGATSTSQGSFSEKDISN